MVGNISMANKKDKGNDGVLLKEASSNLGVSEATIRRYLREFDLPIEAGIGSKAVISNESFQVLTEIAKLRGNGLSIQEIKELRGQEPSKNILDEVEETNESKKEIIQDAPSIDEQLSNGETSLSELENNVENNVEDNVESDSDDKKESDEDKVVQPTSSEEQPIRKRGFDYRYVERQVSNDSKRVISLRRRLQNPNISINERLFFEEALERRILFLNGWKHILRWVSRQ